jgi:hypothetical protein
MLAFAAVSVRGVMRNEATIGGNLPVSTARFVNPANAALFALHTRIKGTVLKAPVAG